MAALLQCIPQGFPEAITDASELPKQMLPQICQDVAMFMLYESGPVDIEKYTQELKGTTSALANVSIRSITNALTYLFRCAAKAKLEVDEFQNQLTSSSLFPRTVVDVLVQLWESKGRQLSSSSSKYEALKVGQLLDLQWKVGMAMSSDDCKNLNSPNVTLLLTVAETGGITRKHSVEMTLSQFRNFSNQLKEMATLMETV